MLCVFLMQSVTAPRVAPSHVTLKLDSVAVKLESPDRAVIAVK